MVKHIELYLSLFLSILATCVSFFIMRILHNIFPPEGADYTYGYGFPLKYYFSGGLTGQTDSYPFFFLLDIVIWFVIFFLILRKYIIQVKVTKNKK